MAYRQLLNQVETHHRHVEERTARVRFLNQELTQMTSALIRQIQLPVARAIAVLDVTRRASVALSQDAAHALDQGERSVRDIETLMESVSGYIRVRGERGSVRPVTLDHVLQGVLAAAQPSLVHRQVHFTHDSLPVLAGDSRTLSLILTELLGNALKLTRKREVATIHLTVREYDTEYVFGLEDNGVGFNMRHKNRLFQLFGHLHSARGFEGTGIGLLSVRWAAQCHWICSQVGTGNGVRVTEPYHQGCRGLPETFHEAIVVVPLCPA